MGKRGGRSSCHGGIEHVIGGNVEPGHYFGVGFVQCGSIQHRFMHRFTRSEGENIEAVDFRAI